MTEAQLTDEAQEKLDRRKQIGEACIAITANVPPVNAVIVGEDREMHAGDAVSDILTALFGPAGTSSYGGAVDRDENAWEKAEDFLSHVMRSWTGDAEDYHREPEPGEYGHEEA